MVLRDVPITMCPVPQGYRFPGFAPHEQDYEPSADHYANMMSAVHWMIVQVRP